MKIGEITDLILSEAAPYFDEAIAQAFVEIEQNAQTYKEAKEEKESFVSKLGKAAKGVALVGGGGYIAHKAGMGLSGKYATGVGKQIQGIGETGMGGVKKAIQYAQHQGGKLKENWNKYKIDRYQTRDMSPAQLKKHRAAQKKDVTSVADTKTVQEMLDRSSYKPVANPYAR